MSEVLAHRGPDAVATWSEGPMGLGHRTLHTTPEAGGERQPLVARDGTRVLTADARIDNRHGLLSALGFRQKFQEEITDAELLLAAYEHWGERCAEHLIGDFAFATWDARRRELLCIRDHFGVKPFYYFHAPGRLFAFASEIQALLVLEEVPDEVNELEVARHLLLLRQEDASTTYYRYVRRLMRAHTLRVSDRGLEERSYWQLDPTRALKLASDDEYAEALRDVFVEAVRCRLRCVTPVATMLSGGFDSASITCVAAELKGDSGGPLHTLSAVYPSVPESDGQSLIDEVLERHHVVPHFFEADRVSPIAEIDRINSFFGGACKGANLYLNWELYRMAADVRAHVVLDGYGGDVILSPRRGYLWDLAAAGKWLRLALAAVPSSRRQSISPMASYLALVRLGLRRRLRGSLVETLARRIRGTTDLQAPSIHRLVLNEDFARRFSNRTVSIPEPPATERESHFRDVNSPSLLDGIGLYEACGAGRGVEVRFPFFDIRVVELCLSFPADQKLRQGWSRFVMRRAMEGILPREIQWNPIKADLNQGWIYAYRSNESDRMEALLTNGRVKRYLDPGRLRALHGKFMAGNTSASEELALWRALSLAVWLAPMETGRPRSFSVP